MVDKYWLRHKEQFYCIFSRSWFILIFHNGLRAPLTIQHFLSIALDYQLRPSCSAHWENSPLTQGEISQHIEPQLTLKATTQKDSSHTKSKLANNVRRSQRRKWITNDQHFIYKEFIETESIFSETTYGVQCREMVYPLYRGHKTIGDNWKMFHKCPRTENWPSGKDSWGCEWYKTEELPYGILKIIMAFAR